MRAWTRSTPPSTSYDDGRWTTRVAPFLDRLRGARGALAATSRRRRSPAMQSASSARDLPTGDATLVRRRDADRARAAASRRASAGPTAQPSTPRSRLPLYVRDKVAQTEAERAAAPRRQRGSAGARPSLSEGGERSGAGAILSSAAKRSCDAAQRPRAMSARIDPLTRWSAADDRRVARRRARARARGLSVPVDARQLRRLARRRLHRVDAEPRRRRPDRLLRRDVGRRRDAPAQHHGRADGAPARPCAAPARRARPAVPAAAGEPALARGAREQCARRARPIAGSASRRSDAGRATTRRPKAGARTPSS